MQPIDFMQGVAISGAVTLFGTQILKNKYVPIPAKEHPRIVAAIIAGISAAYVLYTQHTSPLPTTLAQWFSMAAVAVVGAAIAYNNILKEATSK